MSGLWTPDGERPIRSTPRTPPEASPEAPAEAGALDDDEIDPEELAQRLEQLAQVPAADVVVNHCVGLFELARLHLAQTPPHLDDAQLAIDAFGAIVDTLGDRLGPNGEEMQAALAQLRLAFVQIRAANLGTQPPSPPDSPSS